jgi:hypothetical protein
MMWCEKNLEEFEKWLSEQGLKEFIDGIVNALPDETSTVSYLNHSNEITELLLDAVVTFITRQIEIFAPPPDSERSISQATNDYSSLAASKSERIDAWISCMKAEGRLAPVQEPRLRAILNNVSEEAELSRTLRGLVEFTPSLFTPLLQGDDVSTDPEVDEDSDEDLDFKIQLFQASKSQVSEVTESEIIRDFFEEPIRQAEQETDLERAWVLDRCLGSFKDILELKSAEQYQKLLEIFGTFIDLEALLNKRNSDAFRLNAAQRILTEQIKRPIHPGRWNFVKDELDRLAKQNGCSRNFELQELAKADLFDAIETLIGIDFRSHSSFDLQISADYREIWRRLNDSLTELLAGPGWREKEAARPRLRRKKGTAPARVELTAKPKKQPILDTTVSAEALHIEPETDYEAIEEQQKLKTLLIERLSLVAGKKPEHIERLVAKKSIDDIKTLASELKIERTEMYRKVITPIREEFQKSKNRSSTNDCH